MCVKAPATHISFSPEGGTEMAVAYANTRYLDKQLDDQSSYIWRIGDLNSSFCFRL